MSAAAVTNPITQGESKSSKKKRASRADTGSAAGQHSQAGSAEGKSDSQGNEAAGGADGSSESPYVRELQKNVRNVKKKLGSMQKLDSVIAANPGNSLDELLATRLINADQKAQGEKKPVLQSTLNQLEEQLEHYKKFDEDTKSRFEAEKSLLESSHSDELAKVKEAAETVAKAEASKDWKEKLLSLSRFLRTAAAKRQDGDETAEENRAFEGALLLVYGGDSKAVLAMENIINGNEDQIPTVEGELSGFTYKQIRDASVGSDFAAEEAWVDSVAQSDPAPVAEETAAPVQSDPTVMHASLTEIDSMNAAQTNGGAEHVETPTVPEASNIDSAAANAAADASWQANLSSSMTSGPDGWVDVNKEVPRDPAETDTGVSATPAATHATQSWAEDVPTDPTPAPAPAAPKDDGFHEVHHNRGGRGRGGTQGEHRGGRGRGGYRGDRGRGYRGERGGRGRGGPRGQRGRGESSQ